MNKSIKRIILSIVVTVFVGSFYGCGTIKGLGEDVGAIGGWMSGSSDHVKESVKQNPPGSGME